ncbi:MAG: HNH endonuclease [Elainellaceae cyanobacterium]
MSISLKTHKILWAKSGNRCAHQDCKNELIVDATLTDDNSIIGEEAHIVSRKEDGPRGDHELPLEDRDEYSNLILLCRNHHKEIDDQIDKYSVDYLHTMKKQHEDWVRSNLDISLDDIKIDLRYSNYLDNIIEMANFDNWNGWSSSLLSNGQPSIDKEMYESLKKVPDYIVSRFWPHKYSGLKLSIINFKDVLNDLILVFDKYKEEINGKLWTEKFYKVRSFDQETYHSLLNKFNYHVDLVEDLTLELTRAGNLLCENIRETIYPNFREEEGKLLITTGLDMSFRWQTYVLEYNQDEKTDRPYPGLKDFLEERSKRDLHFGEGARDDYWL